MWYDFFVYMVLNFGFIVSLILYSFFLYVGFDVRKRFNGEPHDKGLNISIKKFKEEYKIADEWWRNR